MCEYYIVGDNMSLGDGVLVEDVIHRMSNSPPTIVYLYNDGKPNN